MKKEFVAPWVAVLRDPKSKQTYRSLYVTDQHSDLVPEGKCCLGHAVQVCIDNRWIDETWRIEEGIGFINDTNVSLPHVVRKLFGIDSSLGYITLPKEFVTREGGRNIYLAGLNDREKLTLPQIADVIEYFWKDL